MQRFRSPLLALLLLLLAPALPALAAGHSTDPDGSPAPASFWNLSAWLDQLWSWLFGEVEGDAVTGTWMGRDGLDSPATSYQHGGGGDCGHTNDPDGCPRRP